MNPAPAFMQNQQRNKFVNSKIKKDYSTLVSDNFKEIQK